MKTLFEISRSGLKTAERSLSTTSNNLINADTPGYSRQRVNQEPAGMRFSDRAAGLGVNMTGITRLRNEMADIQLNDKRQNMGYMQEKAKVFEQMEAYMATDSGHDLDLQISRLFDSFSELSSDPQDNSVRNNLVVEAEQLTDKFGDMSRNLDKTSDLVRESVHTNVQRVNKLIDELASLNKPIVQGGSAGKPDHHSLDIRVKKLEELSELINFESQVQDNGKLELRVNGIQILDGENAMHINSEVDDVTKVYRLRLDNGKIIEPNGGKLGADIEMYEREVPEMKQRLDAVAETLVTRFNDLHLQGYGLEDGTQRNFFNPTNVSASSIELNDVIKNNQQHIAASSVVGEAGNGDIAAGIANIRNENLISGRKVTDYAVDLISKPGENLSNVRAQMEARDSEIQMLKTQQERESGVNIDEELSLMIKYQNAYQGAAKAMQAAQQMYDTLLSIVR